MKKILILFVFALVVSFTQAQKVSVADHDVTVDKIQRTGVATFLDLDKKFVEKLWKDELKQYGKVSTSKGFYYIEIAQIPAISQNNVRVISTVENTSKGTMVWWAIDLGSSFVMSGEKGYSNTVGVMKEFAKKCYVEDISEQIEDAEKALEKSIKEQEKIIKEGENLQGDLESNASEKQRLEEALKSNADEKVNIQNSISENKDNKTNADKDVADMKKAVEVVRKKLDSIEVE